MSDKIAVCSMFRDNMVWHGHKIDQIPRYFKQMLYQSYDINLLDFYLLEGDSVDSTSDALQQHLKLAPFSERVKNLIKFDLNFPYKTDGSKDRLEALSKITDMVLHSIDYSMYRWILWIEADLIIQNDLIQQLINTSLLLRKPNMVAPYIALGDLFYDSFVFTELSGKKWDNYTRPHRGIFNMASVGSCILIDTQPLIKYQIGCGSNALIGFCCQARAIGYTIYADTNIIIQHPNQYINNRWV